MYTSLDKDVSMALGQNVRDMLSLKIYLKMDSVILENPDNPLTFYMYMYTESHVDKTSKPNKIPNMYSLNGPYVDTYALIFFSIFTEVYSKYTFNKTKSKITS